MEKNDSERNAEPQPESRDRRRAGAQMWIRRMQLRLKQKDVVTKAYGSPTNVPQWSEWERKGVEVSRTNIRRIEEGLGYYNSEVARNIGRAFYGRCLDDDVFHHLSVTDAFDHETVLGRSGGLVSRARATLHEAAMEPMLLKLKPGESTCENEPLPHAGEELILVLSGKLLFEWLAKGKLHREVIGPEGVLHFQASIPHRLSNPKPAKRKQQKQGATSPRGKLVVALLVKHPPDRYSKHTLDDRVREIDRARK